MRIYASRARIYSFILFTMRTTVNTPECRCVNAHPSFCNIHSINKVRITFPALISRAPAHRSYATAVANVVVAHATPRRQFHCSVCTERRSTPAHFSRRAIHINPIKEEISATLRYLITFLASITIFFQIWIYLLHLIRVFFNFHSCGLS